MHRYYGRGTSAPSAPPFRHDGFTRDGEIADATGELTILDGISLAVQPGRIVTVPVTDDAASSGDRAEVFARHGVTAQLVYGGIVEISERPYGSLTYALDGSVAAVDAALAELAASGGVEEHDLEELR